MIPDSPAPDRPLPFFLSPWARVLTPISWIYGWAARRRRLRLTRRAARLPVPVISVGNITAGGTGKTPVVELVARELAARGRRPAIISRGYGGGVGPGKVNDEYLVLEANLPGVRHLQDPARARGGRRAIEEGADVLVLDDGFQHAALARDLDLVLIDAINPFGFGRVLPAGLLREPIDALGLASAIILTRCRHSSREKLELLIAFLAQRFPRIPRLEIDFQPEAWVPIAGGREEPPGSLSGRRALGFAGIGNPEGFRRELVGLGLRLVEWISFPDHHRYTQGDIRRLRERARTAGADAVVLTQKDAVKIGAAELEGNLPWMFLRIRARIAAGEEILRGLLDGVLARPCRP